jgi:nicotinate phosphoribosyltransferase
VGVRKILDDNGCSDISIFCSGSLDEYTLAKDFADETPVDGFGIGTHLDVSADAPYLDCAYKIEEYAGIARRKRSSGKSTWPGRKQVYRVNDSGGRLRSDLVALVDEQAQARALLEYVMRSGLRVVSTPTLDSVRDHAASELAALPDAMRDPFRHVCYPVEISTSLQALASRVDSTFR